MSKKIFKGILVGMIAFALAVLIGYTSYILALNHALSKTQANLKEPDTATAEAYTEQVPLSTESVTIAESYIARLDDDKISIFAVTNGRESFMYNLDVYIGDLPESDLNLLKKGVLLEDKEALAKFEEDYTS